ncbi:uncharacterized protein LOC127933238 [Carassius gibelio]|uniref:uncharacterized protein LOC127933238 n=1 Tax=Carassius gibelio TaxID=101364 RepID=UPI002279C42B|nr:uncharacterized protein LOC127933238 [Carassius gibelio]
MISPTEVLKMLESDFVEKFPDDVNISQDDLKFLAKIRKGIRHKEDGHFEMPLPFKSERPNLPDNKACAIHRLKCSGKKLKRNKQYYMDYKKFMDEIIALGDAERVPEQDIDKRPAWYIPHHGVYHPQKPGKIRVVFDASAKFRDTSLNDHLLTGPELTNTLLGVLYRFRRGPVAFMCDIESLFHQFHVNACDQDYLWWENRDLETPFTVYRMKVHLFGAASSPGCANYGLKHLAAEGEGSFDEETIKFIKTNFYVDDGLGSVDTEEQAIQLVNEARKLCRMCNLRLHKFISNSTQVLALLPKEECAVVAKDLDMALGEVHVFVANRVERIKQGTESTQWWYVTSKDNPADHASRGLTAEQLVASNWFKGPDLLWQKVITSSVLKVGELSNSDPEVRKVQVHTIQVEEQRSLLDWLQKFSDWLRMIKAVARLKRYVKEAKDHKKSCNIVNLQETKEAEVTIIKMVQAAAFTQEIKTLQHQEVMQTKNRVSKLCPFLDNQGLLREGGRLTHAALHPNVSHPVILPKNSHVSTLLVKHYHEKTYHQGRGITMNELRANGYWIL